MRAVDYAKKDWAKGVSEADRASLDPMFSTAGWSSRAPRAPEPVPDWCGFATYYWLRQAGLALAHRKSFFHTLNVEAFYTYGAKSNVNPKRLMSKGQVAGSKVWEPLFDIHTREFEKSVGDGTPDNSLLRVWMSAVTLRAVAKEFDFRPDDTILINHSGKVDKAHHITTVKEYDAKRNVLHTIEGNASGSAYGAGNRREAVVVVKRDLNLPRELNKLYGMGRISKLDLDGSHVTAYAL